MRFARHFEKGFTLIELIMVMVIAGILAVAVIPHFSGVSSISLDGAAEMIVADIRYAQQLAMAEHRQYNVQFTASTNSYRVYNDPGGPVVSIDFDEIERIQGVTIDADFQEVFNSLGVPTGGGGSVTLNGSKKTITITQYTGKVTVAGRRILEAERVSPVRL